MNPLKYKEEFRSRDKGKELFNIFDRQVKASFTKLKYNSNFTKKDKNQSYLQNTNHLLQIKSPSNTLNLTENNIENNIENFQNNNRKKMQRIIGSNYCILNSSLF